MKTKNSLATVVNDVDCRAYAGPVIWWADFTKLINLINGMGWCEQAFLSWWWSIFIGKIVKLE
ncbi:hypothetical protein [Burkholderia pseudomallei]|uniref:hypothetical protein n=1 Tax=Burkholderia pseudomallei TaxID=28450 RepID=UPI000A490BE5|nr:hypothetical protein [Burkholderia pseudomallei]